MHHLIDGDDFLWSTTDVAIWSTVEPGIGIAAASIATLRPLWQLICYRTGLSSEVPANLRWRERNRGKRTYIRSDGSGSRRTPRLRPHINTSLTNITIEASDTVFPKDHLSPRLSAVSSQAGITKTAEFVAFGTTAPLSPLPVEVRLLTCDHCLGLTDIRIASCYAITNTGTLEAIISKRRARSKLPDGGLEHSANVRADNGMVKKLKIEHRNLKVS